MLLNHYTASCQTIGNGNSHLYIQYIIVINVYVQGIIFKKVFISIILIYFYHYILYKIPI